MLLRWTCLLFSIVFTSACGQNRVVEVKDFKVFVESDEPGIQDVVKKLVGRYNQEFGSDVLTLVGTQAESNSLIRFEDNLREDGNKLGTGQWITTTTLGKAMSLEGEVRTTKIDFGMEVAFDSENFRSKAEKFDVNSEANQHLYHLFCHEIGHGMQMDHTEDRHSVMFPSIPEKANREIAFGDYFSQARSFMGSSPVQNTTSSRFPNWGK